MIKFRTVWTAANASLLSFIMTCAHRERAFRFVDHRLRFSWGSHLVPLKQKYLNRGGGIHKVIQYMHAVKLDALLTTNDTRGTQTRRLWRRQGLQFLQTPLYSAYSCTSRRRATFKWYSADIFHSGPRKHRDMYENWINNKGLHEIMNYTVSKEAFMNADIIP
jgi:hypothetical protein